MKNLITIITVIALLTIFAFGEALNASAGAPANSIAILGDAPQEVVWKNSEAAVFRAPDGTEKFVQVYTPSLEVGAKYKVRSWPHFSKVGYFYTFSLEKI